MPKNSVPNIDFSQMQSAAALRAAEGKARADRIRSACSAGIEAVVTLPTQANLVSAAALGQLEPPQQAAYRELVTWIGDMRKACAAKIAAPADLPADPGVWPEVPSAAAALARAF